MDSKNITKEYPNQDITVVWKSGLCCHAAKCVQTNPEVFRPTEKPWIVVDNKESEHIIKAVNLCPSGALTYYKNKP